MTKTFKASVNPDHLVTRSIPIVWESASERDEALATLAAMPFVQDASYDAAKSALAVLTGHGAHILGGWRQRLLDAWHRFQDHTQAAGQNAENEPVVHTAPQNRRDGRPLRQHRP